METDVVSDDDHDGNAIEDVIDSVCTIRLVTTCSKRFDFSCVPGS